MSLDIRKLILNISTVVLLIPKFDLMKNIKKFSWLSGQFSWISMQKVVGEWYYPNLVTNTGHQPKKSGQNQDGQHPENVVLFSSICITGKRYEHII